MPKPTTGPRRRRCRLMSMHYLLHTNEQVQSRLRRTARLHLVCRIPAAGAAPRGAWHTLKSKLLIISQAPGTKVHNSGISFSDRSGDRLRDWLGVDRDTFYDESRIAIMPMGARYPRVNDKGGDLPPRTERAPLWPQRLLPLFPQSRTDAAGGFLRGELPT